MKKEKVSTLKKKAWAVFSIYIRRKYADWHDNVDCVTCGATKNWKQMQAGHFIAGRGNSILFEVTNVHPQCYVCNVINHGEQLKYYRFMIAMYGEDEVKRLEKLSKQPHSFTIEELKEIIETYKWRPQI